jgi:hypothetical protein
MLQRRRAARAQHVEEMDGGRFEKLCRDCGLVDRKAVTSTEVDLAFARAKAKGARRLSFERFLDALALLAERKGASLAELAAAVLAARGPCVTGTRADYVKFHDDKARARAPRRAAPGRTGSSFASLRVCLQATGWSSMSAVLDRRAASTPRGPHSRDRVGLG